MINGWLTLLTWINMNDSINLQFNFKTMEKIKYFNPKMGLKNSRKWVNFYWAKTFYSQKIAMQAIAEANLIIFSLNKKSA